MQQVTELYNNPEMLVERTESASGRFTLIDRMRVEKGSKADWDELHALHYKAENLPAGSRYWRCMTDDDDLVGIVVTCAVSLLLKPRHAVFPRLRPGAGGGDTHFTNVQRGRWLNKNMRRAARIVTDTMYRGVGVSYRMVNLANRLEGFRFSEIQSSMSKFNPFDIKAGYSHAHLIQATMHDRGLKFFRRLFKSHPADHQELMLEWVNMPPSVKASVEREVKGFYFDNSAKEKTGMNLRQGSRKVDSMPFSAVLKELQQLVFASPVYGIWEHPDLHQLDKMPDSLRLSAFDLQGPNEPLRLDLL